MITPHDFVERWAHSQLREQQAAQSHFNELCELVGYKTPTQLDPEGTFFTFEEQVTKATGGKGRADVWYKGKFAWEYKGKHRDLDAAYAQLLAYKGDLDNPPLLVVCDFLEYRIYPQWPNTSGLPFVFRNEDLLNKDYLRFITWLLESPDQFLELRRSELERREQITLDLAFKFAHLADLMRQEALGGGYQWQPLQIARFLTKLVFALFAEDIGLLPVIANAQPALRFIIEGAKRAPQEFVPMLQSLFEAMDGAHYFMMYYVPYFNGGVFRESQPGSNDGYEVLDITFIPGAINLLEEVSDKDWRFVNPTIFGTLFEGALDVSKRAQLGAHYTGESDIQLVIEPVLMQPLTRQWQIVETEAQPLMQVYLNPDLPPRPVHEAGVKLQALYQQMMTSLSQTRVLDPACGSGNFLYMSLRALKDLEGRVRRVFEPLQLPYADAVTPRQLYGIEKDEFAANLAKVVVWIGYLQWRYEDEGGVLHYANPRKSGEHPRQLTNPILKDKNSPDEPDRIVCDDAIMRYAADGISYEPEWPEVDVIIGNPPFLGGYKQRSELGGDYLENLWSLYKDRVPGSADLVCYWFEKARTQIEAGKAKRAGLLATNSIRGGANREVLTHIKDTGDIFMAWSDREWVLEGAAVRISIVGFDARKEANRTLDGQTTISINADLTKSVDGTAALSLTENQLLCFRTDEKGGPFDIPDEVARKLLKAVNLNGLSNSDVVRPYLNGLDITRQRRNMWIIDFGIDISEQEAAVYKAPYEYTKRVVKPVRNAVRNEREQSLWWIHRRPAPDMRIAVSKLQRFIATPAVAKHRIFVWLESKTIPDHQLYAVAREDDYFFGVLHSYLHETWALRLGTSLEDRPRYTPTTTFETFPFPWSPGKEDTASPHYAAISAAAKQLHEEREAWLNPPDLIALGADSKALKERTLTNLYNALVAFRTSPPNPLSVYREGEKNGNGNGKKERIAKSARDFAPRLAQLHDALDAAVLAAYGWDDLNGKLRTAEGDEELLRRLLALNLQRAASTV